MYKKNVLADKAKHVEKFEETRKKLKDLSLSVTALAMDAEGEQRERLNRAFAELDAAYRAHIRSDLPF